MKFHVNRARKKKMSKTHTTKYVGISLIRYVWDTNKEKQQNVSES